MVDQFGRPERTAAEDKHLKDAGYKPENHPRWMFLEFLLQAKAELHAQHEANLAAYGRTRSRSW